MKKLITFIQKTWIDYILVPLFAYNCLWAAVLATVAVVKKLGISHYSGMMLLIIFAIAFARLHKKSSKNKVIKQEYKGKPLYTLHAKF